jgi:hypothetical protein
MKKLPFQMTPDAESWMVSKLESGASNPDFATLAPALFYCLDYTMTDEAGRVLERCRFPFFDVGWDSPITLARQGCVSIEIDGRRVFTSPDTFQRLAGKQLILETIDVGFPVPATMQREFLRAAPVET